MSEPRPKLRGRALVNIGLNQHGLSAGEAQALPSSVSATERGWVRHGLFFASA